jgi:MIR domain
VPLYELNASTGFSRFRAVPYCTFDEDDSKFLKGGSIVTLKHSELGGLLSSDDNDFTNDGLAEVFLWVFKGKEDDYENFNTQSLFEVEIAIPENMGMIARTSDDQNYQHKYRLRHLNTGRLVTIQTIDFNGDKVVTLGLAEHIKL